MNEKIKRIYEFMDELANAAKEVFPDFTTISAVCANDGYRDVTVMKWGKGKTVETIKRRELFGQTRVESEWSKDRSDDMNKSYEKQGLLLKDD